MFWDVGSQVINYFPPIRYGWCILKSLHKWRFIFLVAVPCGSSSPKDQIHQNITALSSYPKVKRYLASALKATLDSLVWLWGKNMVFCGKMSLLSQMMRTFSGPESAVTSHLPWLSDAMNDTTCLWNYFVMTHNNMATEHVDERTFIEAILAIFGQISTRCLKPLL